jgi:predicted AlkP superfamily phosphohydrolase/phosphomutase
VRFDFLPHVVDAAGICRFYLQRAQGDQDAGRFALYVSPVNIDPAHPGLPISTPPDYSRRLVRELGYFYTQGIVEDTQALRAGVLDTEEYQQQALFVHQERIRFFEHELGRFQKGFLFFYFSTLDQNSHVFWHAIDPQHPLYSRELAERHGDFIAALYQKVDTAVGQALERLDERSWLMVLSDHGFTSFRRQFNLNSWLLDHGYIRTLRPPLRDGSTLFQDVDWKRTRAYGVGLNGLYLNRQGRESQGTVRTDLDADRLLRELATRLESFRDPDSGEQVILKVALTRDEYSGPLAATGPDLLVGYNRGYRASWDTILGGFPRQHVLDNTDAWSGDHCVDPAVVPGVLLSSRPLSKVAPRIEDLAPTILDAFGVPVPEGMTGRKLV